MIVTDIFYAIGIQKIKRDGIEMAMTHGPTPYEKEMLDVLHVDDRAYIIKLFPDNSHQLLWRWNGEKDKWIRWHPRILNKNTNNTTKLNPDVKRSGLDTIYIGRGSKWGNPFKVPQDGTRQEVIHKYTEYLLEREDLLEALPELENKFLECFCAPLPCHGDILIDLANPIVEIPEISDESEQQYPSETMGSQLSARTLACSKYTQDFPPEKRNPTDAFDKGFDAGVEWQKTQDRYSDDIPY
jgi:hypothetical protein